ncbi:hypothetical protein GIB67_020973 [Kingdonia uniflora]|uniref:Pentatricopeptide repeat-containing protein n=1 Tax=Kingdonia uniflora TaxID=39325 RepID=A0A7J7M7V4_9MAGN|nr:hypothetical protein GIB67_020973 [Kingdonia uniflora]
MFDKIEHLNEITWNVIVRRYLQMGEMREAVFMFFKAVASVRPLDFTFRGALMACSSILELKEGCQIHGVVIKVDFEESQVI